MSNPHSALALMMRAISQRAPRFAGIVLLASVALAGCNKDYTAFALTSTGNIIEFATNKPSDINNQVNVTGLTGSETLVQIAYSPNGPLTSSDTSVLYAVTSSNELCQVDPLGGAVSNCFAAFTSDVLSNVAASFDPVSGYLRIIANDSSSSTGRVNILLDSSTGQLASGQPISYDLGYSDGTSGTPQINALAYNNAIEGADSSTLYALDVNGQRLDRIGDTNAANTTSVSEGGVYSIGTVGSTFTSSIGFAIAPQDGTAYAALGGASSLYTVDLSSGLATLVGAIDTANFTVISLAISPQ